MNERSIQKQGRTEMQIQITAQVWFVKTKPVFGYERLVQWDRYHQTAGGDLICLLCSTDDCHQ